MIPFTTMLVTGEVLEDPAGHAPRSRFYLRIASLFGLLFFAYLIIAILGSVSARADTDVATEPVATASVDVGSIGNGPGSPAAATTDPVSAADPAVTSDSPSTTGGTSDTEKATTTQDSTATDGGTGTTAPDPTTDPGTDPVSTEPVTTEPDPTTDPGHTDPVTTDPGTDPVTTDPGTDPVTTDPGTDPVTTDPGTDPVTTDPGTDPVTTDPGTDPVTTDPVTTDPVITDPIVPVAVPAGEGELVTVEPIARTVSVVAKSAAPARTEAATTLSVTSLIVLDRHGVPSCAALSDRLTGGHDLLGRSLFGGSTSSANGFGPSPVFPRPSPPAGPPAPNQALIASNGGDGSHARSGSGGDSFSGTIEAIHLSEPNATSTSVVTDDAASPVSQSQGVTERPD